MEINVPNQNNDAPPTSREIGVQPFVTSHATNGMGEYCEPSPSKVVRHRPVSAYQDGYEIIRIDDGEKHWVVATSITEALRLHGVETLGYSTVEAYREDMGPLRVKRLFPHECVKVTYDDGRVVERKAWEWAVDHRGVICSTNW